MLYNFIFEQKNNFRRIFLLFIIGLILVGSGLGVSICNYMSFDKVSDNKSNIKYLSATEEIDIKDDLILDFLYHGSATLVVDNNISNIKIDIEYPEKSKYHLYNYQSRYYPGDYEYNRSNYNIYNHYDLSCYNDYDFIEEFNEVLNDIKNKERKNYVYDYECRIKITTSLDNINKLKSNYSVMYDY